MSSSNSTVPETSAPQTTQPSSTPASSTPAPAPSTSTSATTSAAAPTTPTTTSQSTPPVSTPQQSTTQAPTTSAPTVVTTIIESSSGLSTITRTEIVTSNPTSTLSTSSSASATATSAANNGDKEGSSSGGLSDQAKIAVLVVVPIAAVALLVLAGLWFWRKRKARKDAEEQRRKEVEEYGFNPNADGPTVPDVASDAPGAYAMAEDTSSGYRGWGSTTLGGSTGRKASTTISSSAPPGPFSDVNSPTRGHNMSDSRSGEPLMYDAHGDGSTSPEGEILGAMGPSAAANRGADVRRGPSNASSSYSAAARSDGSGDMNGIGMAYGGGDYPPQSYNAHNNYGINNPYADPYGGGGGAAAAGPAPAMAEGGRGSDFNGGSSSPIIRDNPARRNTRIESSSHYPQQSAGISQNF